MLVIFDITIVAHNCVCIVEVDILLLLQMLYFLFHFPNQCWCAYSSMETSTITCNFHLCEELSQLVLDYFLYYRGSLAPYRQNN